MAQRCYLRTWFRLSQFSLAPGSNPGLHYAFGHHLSLGSSNLWQFLSLSLTSMALHSWRALISYFVKCPTIWACLISLLSLGYKKRGIRAMTSTAVIVMTLALVTWWKWCQPDAPTVKFFPFHVLFLEASYLVHPTLKERVIKLHLLERRVSEFEDRSQNHCKRLINSLGMCIEFIQVSCFSLILLTNFSINQWILPASTIPVDFYFSHSFHICYFKFSCEENVSFLPQLSIIQALFIIIQISCHLITGRISLSFLFSP